MTLLDLLPILAAVHFLCDFGLQNDYVAANKVPGRPNWAWVLTAHAAIHGLGVGLVFGFWDAGTGPWFLGLAEFLAHWITDYGKGRAWYGFTADQAIHLGHKMLWIAAVAGMYWVAGAPLP